MKSYNAIDNFQLCCVIVWIGATLLHWGDLIIVVGAVLAGSFVTSAYIVRHDKLKLVGYLLAACLYVAISFKYLSL